MRRDAIGVWTRVAVSTVVGAVTLVAVDPPRPEARLSWAVAVPAGAAAGLALFVAVARRRASPLRAAPTPAATLAFLALFALNEEVIWRRLVLGETLRGGAVAGVAVSTIAFALMHRVRRATHLVTGAVFGCTYVFTGSLAASVVAHWTYNVLVAAVLPRARAPAEAPA
ncbi:MAG TPA: CPBP family intramembrane glutamic endopeptidase [Gaiellaceae bacterium]|nr:CPBP family intramembrane glutamic endopeptidase [Gaiellaceae bacterium]